MNDHKFSFNGDGNKLFGIVIINLLLTVITLGIYYPWAKAALLQYLYKETELAGSPFTFHGTGKEMFRGFIKAILILAVIYGVFFAFIHYQMPIIGASFFYLAIGLLMPLIIHGSMRYRMSRTSWRGIHFGYRGLYPEFAKKFYKDLFFSIITLGIYSFWLTINIRKYTIGHTRYGDVKFSYKGDGGTYFGLIIGGYFLTIITFGIYGFWWMKDLFNYYYTNIELHQDNKTIPLKSTITGGGLFSLLIVNFLIVIFSFGIAAPWAQVRTLRYMCKNLTVGKNFNPNSVTQTEEEYKDATGEDLGDMFDIGII